MKRWALVKDGIVRRLDVDAQMPQAVLGHVWLPIEQTVPTFDPDTEELEGPTVTVLADKVTNVWTGRAKTAAELDNVKELKLAGAFEPVNVALLRLLFNVHNRVRVIEGQPQHTPAQFRAFVKGLL